VATPLEQLNGAYEAAMNAEGQAFFRRLSEYLGLLRENRRIERVVKALSAEVQEAERKYAEEDEQLAREFVALRGDLVELAPEAGEDETRPPALMRPSRRGALRSRSVAVGRRRGEVSDAVLRTRRSQVRILPPL
jgi:hypothetical protein